MDLIYCGGNNERLMRLALDAGWLLGVRSDRTSYGFPLAFVDCDYRRPNWERHLRRVGTEHPTYATVPDLSETSVDGPDVERAIRQADQLAAYCAVPLIVPKLRGQMALIPTQYAIAYSVPTTYGGARYGPWLLDGRRVHLLGGSPTAQRRIYRYLRGRAKVTSVDGNMAQKVALRNLNYWSRRNVWVQAPRGTPYVECWRRSVDAIAGMWRCEVEVTA